MESDKMTWTLQIQYETLMKNYFFIEIFDSIWWNFLDLDIFSSSEFPPPPKKPQWWHRNILVGKT